MITAIAITAVVGIVVGLLIGVNNPTVGAATKKLIKDGEVKVAAGIKKL